VKKGCCHGTSGRQSSIRVRAPTWLGRLSPYFTGEGQKGIERRKESIQSGKSKGRRKKHKTYADARQLHREKTPPAEDPVIGGGEGIVGGGGGGGGGRLS